MARTPKLATVRTLYDDLNKVKKAFVREQWMARFTAKHNQPFYDALDSPTYQDLMFFADVFEVSVEALLAQYKLTDLVPISQYQTPLQRQASTRNLVRAA